MHSHMDEEDDISFATAYVPPLSNSVVKQPSSGISNEQTLELVLKPRINKLVVNGRLERAKK